MVSVIPVCRSLYVADLPAPHAAEEAQQKGGCLDRYPRQGVRHHQVLRVSDHLFIVVLLIVNVLSSIASMSQRDRFDSKTLRAVTTRGVLDR